MGVKLAMHVICMDDSTEMLRLLSMTDGYFDKVRVCVGVKTGDVYKVLSRYDCKTYYQEWQDDMSVQHNILLDEAKKGEWIFIMDVDECPTKELLKKLRDYAEEAEKIGGYHFFRITSIMELDGKRDWSVHKLIKTIKKGGEAERFRKEIYFKYDGFIKYEGTSHYGLQYSVTKHWTVHHKIPEPYIHYKFPVDIVRCDIQQGFINPEMQGINEEDAQFLKNGFTRMGISSSIDMIKSMESGVSFDLESFFISRRDPELGCISRFFEYYFLIHHSDKIKYHHPLCGNIKSDPALLRHFIELGGYRQRASYMIINDISGKWLPIGHLDMSEDLRNLINSNMILLEEDIENDNG